MSEDPKPGLYEELITEVLDKKLQENFPKNFIDREKLDDDSHLLLARHFFGELENILEGISNKPEEQTKICNQLIKLVNSQLSENDQYPYVVSPPEALYAIGNPHSSLKEEAKLPPRPTIPVGQSDLLINAKNEPRIGHLLQEEIQSADRIDLLCAFIRWHGLRILREPLKELIKDGKKIRIITTTYMGASEKRAVDWLSENGAQVKVCYETQTTRLHAKAWLFHRKTGFSTAFIGSSNISHSALMDGLEWNVRLSEVENPSIFEKFQAAFDEYWEDEMFETYTPKEKGDKFKQAIQQTKGTEDTHRAFVDVSPRPHQKEILDQLKVERKRHARYKNLVVSATGTGKTMVAAFDFQRWRKENPDAKLLFVAHREDILEQSLDMFRTVLKDGSFGELLVGKHEPEDWNNVFASIQSLTSRGPDLIKPEAYDYVVMDEFHHAAAQTYKELLDHLKPGILLGLTATPERADGQTVLDWFDHRISAEIRLWDALDRNLLSPFQYFGIHDNTSLKEVNWSGGRYAVNELENLYTGDHARVSIIEKELVDKVVDVSEMKALGFCVSIDHAEFMADEFNKRGISALALHSKSPERDRRSAKHRLVSGELNVLFTIDLFNEGVDIPEVDTVLFLRPTESPTVFLQQLGRGLRHSDEKSCLTVLDFIGNAHQNFRYDIRYRALTGSTRKELKQNLDKGFPNLPPGCSIKLDREATKVVLNNIKTAVGSSITRMAGELKQYGDLSLAEFIDQAVLEIEDIYQTKNWYWTKLRRLADLQTDSPGPMESKFGGRLHRILYLEDETRLSFYKHILANEEPPNPETFNEMQKKQLYMLHFSLWGDTKKYREKWPNLESIINYIWRHPNIRKELLELITYLDNEAEHITQPLWEKYSWAKDVPMEIHAQYSLAEIRTAFGLLTPQSSTDIREGVRYLEDYQTDLFFVTLEKTDKHYSPKTMYKDYAISPKLFHWESQWNTSDDTPTGQRYINHRKQGTNVLLFVRQKKKEGGQSMPYIFIGPADYVKHEGNKPMQITWRLKHEMPEDLFYKAKVVAS